MTRPVRVNVARSVFFSCLLWSARTLAVPENDACTAPTVITAIPFTADLGTDPATVEPDEPGPCPSPQYRSAGYSGFGAVWFRYLATKDATLCIRSCPESYGSGSVEALTCGDPDTCTDCTATQCGVLLCTQPVL